MQLDTFVDERMKILYALSFMHGGIAQVWAENETNVILSYTSTFTTLAELLSSIERTFGDPDKESMTHAQLHALKMTMGMMADKYMAKFMLADRTGFNNAALEDAFIRGLCHDSFPMLSPIPLIVTLVASNVTSPIPLGPIQLNRL